jgi:dephospho-CoA kinase
MTKRIGLTGGIACGKSEVLDRLKSLGVPVLDTDSIAHDLLKSGNPVFEQIVNHFGKEILQKDGHVDRSIVGRKVFRDEKARNKLNELMHPEIGIRWRDWMKKQCADFAVVAIPLLFEVGHENEFDGILCVASPEAIMMKRLQNRNLSEEEAMQRIRAQLPVDVKAQKSTWNIQNNLTLSHLYTQVDTWVEKMIHQEND